MKPSCCINQNAAGDQLKVWADRVKAKYVSGDAGADASAFVLSSSKISSVVIAPISALTKIISSSSKKSSSISFPVKTYFSFSEKDFLVFFKTSPNAFLCARRN